MDEYSIYFCSGNTIVFHTHNLGLTLTLRSTSLSHEKMLCVALLICNVSATDSEHPPMKSRTFC